MSRMKVFTEFSSVEACSPDDDVASCCEVAIEGCFDLFVRSRFFAYSVF